jgi:hypothetical protein
MPLEKNPYHVTELVEVLPNKQLKQVCRHSRFRRRVAALEQGIHIPIRLNHQLTTYS